ncbi:cytosolic phospholipase A2 gamma [Notechis scutatus]|uniref:Cytosolic phospholipase A2 gamma n=1 Tax=Notechis scutatus TaxID=8663 RepID=A0A6J1VN06_9SAUR|nr:cytosolic phospholipase A2 gamma [Notechis scutatus]
MVEHGELLYPSLTRVSSHLIRISRDISNHEKQIVEARKCSVKKGLQKFNIECSMNSEANEPYELQLGFGGTSTLDKVGSGGGLRAMIALQGILGELQEQHLLDIVMYLCGVSGSTWCMSYIYEHEEWGKQLSSLEDKLCHKLVNPHRDWNKALKSLVESSKDDTYSLTDFWGIVVVYIIMHELDDHHLSDEQKICKNGIVPYPIYAAVDATKLDAAANQIHSDIWFEFTPHEAGFFNPGEFVDVTFLGSKFENGELKEKKNEMKMTYLRGLWGSAVANFKEDMTVLIGIWDIIKCMYKTLTCILKWKWGNIYTYKYIDLKDKNLTDKTDIQLADASIVINSAYPLILRPERKVELILSFDFSDGDPFETIKKTNQYCEENKLPFPEIDAQNLDKDKDNPGDCYIFKGNGCPTVMHFPLFNKVNCGGNISDWRNRYKTFSLSYPEQDIKNLLEATKKNVKNNTKNILQMLKAVANP